MLAAGTGIPGTAAKGAPGSTHAWDCGVDCNDDTMPATTWAMVAGSRAGEPAVGFAMKPAVISSSSREQRREATPTVENRMQQQQCKTARMQQQTERERDSHVTGSKVNEYAHAVNELRACG